MSAPQYPTRFILLLSALVLTIQSPLCAGGSFLPTEPLEVEASAGRIRVVNLSPLQVAGALTGAFRFIELRSDGRWAPSAFVGFRDIKRNGKFRVFLYQTTPHGPLIAGYDYVLYDQLVTRKLIVDDIPKRAALHVSVAWSARGEFQVSFYDGAVHLLDTELRSLVPFVAVSSAKVKFSFAVNETVARVARSNLGVLNQR